MFIKQRKLTKEFSGTGRIRIFIIQKNKFCTGQASTDSFNQIKRIRLRMAVITYGHFCFLIFANGTIFPIFSTGPIKPGLNSS